MSQYGARGQAKLGASYQDIISYYYAGVAIETVDDLVASGEIDAAHPLVADPTPVWVGIRQSISVVDIAPVGGPFHVCQTVDDVATCVDIGWSAEATAETWQISSVDDGGSPACLIERVDPGPGGDPPFGPGDCDIDVTWGGGGQATRVTLDGDLCGDPAAGLGRECFARGSLHIRDDSVAGGFHIAVQLGVEEYLYGLGEMPSSWHEQALKAQALAGRSYLIRRVLTHENPELADGENPGLTSSRKASCWCHLYSTTLDQSYTGYRKEAETFGETVWGEYWVAAVDGSVGEVITHPEASPATVILAFYHSSSGGHTESNEAIWGTTALPYLVPVPDPWSNDPSVGNPYASWTITASAGDLAAELGWDAVTHVDLTVAAPDGALEIRGIDDGESVLETKPFGWMYYAVGSRSPHFDAVNVDRFEPFLDIFGSVHSQAIYDIWEAGITSGCSDDYYCPNDFVTRAQMATFLGRAMELDPVDTGPFLDIGLSGPHYRYINAVAEAEITFGCKDGYFCPIDFVTRAQMASFLARALGLEPLQEGPFSDVSGPHAGSINAIFEKGITFGCGGGEFCSADPVTRAQMASFLARAFVWVEAP